VSTEKYDRDCAADGRMTRNMLRELEMFTTDNAEGLKNVPGFY